MNLTRPIQLISVGALLSTSGILVLFFLVDILTKADFDLLTYLMILVSTAVITGTIFYFLIKTYINQRIKLIYRIIANRKFEKVDLKEASIREDVIGQLTEETRKWAQEKATQISSLQKDAAFRKEFIGNLAHELKTPVFSIQGYLLTLLEGGLEDTNVNREFCERALRGVDRISALLEDLDTISEFEINRVQINPVKFDIVRLTKEIFEEIGPKATLKNIKLVMAKPYDKIMVEADQKRIAQVLTNLISNSISYGNDNGTTTVRFHSLESDQVLIEVADNGLGMEERHLNRLFERFYRVDKSRERHVGGSGLGLAIVKHIVEAHNQSINVRSTPEVGSTFSFTLKQI